MRSIVSWATRSALPPSWVRSRARRRSARVQTAASSGRVVRASGPASVAGFADARTATPLILEVSADESESYAREAFGPISFVVEAADTSAAIRLAAEGARRQGAITAAIYSTDETVLAAAEAAFAETGTALSCNLLGGIYVNQSAAFSDYHVSGANRAGNACLTDSAFVAGRFRVAMVRRLASV